MRLSLRGGGLSGDPPGAYRLDQHPGALPLRAHADPLHNVSLMGCLLDGFSMIVMSLPIALPLVRLAGFDPLWFGIFLIIMIQLAQITPPVGSIFS